MILVSCMHVIEEHVEYLVNLLRGKSLFPRSKKLYTHCLVQVGSRNGFKSVSISLIKLPTESNKNEFCINLLLIFSGVLTHWRTCWELSQFTVFSGVLTHWRTCFVYLDNLLFSVGCLRIEEHVEYLVNLLFSVGC
jgi:hypothetical protein